MRTPRPRGEHQPQIDWRNDYCVARGIEDKSIGELLPEDLADQASIFPPHSEVKVDMPKSIVRPLAYQLSRFVEHVLLNPVNRSVRYTYNTNIPGITHDYTVYKSENGPFGLPYEMAWVADPYDDPTGREIILSDALSLTHLNMPSYVRDGYFIFRAGNMFSVNDSIDFVPGVNDARENPERQFAVPVSGKQLVALTAELTEISDHYATKYAA